MKTATLTILLCILWGIGAFGQSKRDCYWMMGYEDSAPDTSIWGASVMDFCGDSLQIYEIDRPMNFDRTNASICDEDGNLLFYTNGVYIANRLHQPMLNGTGLVTPGTLGFNEYGIPGAQAILILPWPEQPHKYLVFYGRLGGMYYNDTLIIAYLSLHYSVVDMTLDNGLGAVTQKNVLLSSDTLRAGRIHAVRHANGRDWWLVAKKLGNFEMLRFLITPSGVINYGPAHNDNFVVKSVGQVAFSPDGNYYVEGIVQEWGKNYVLFFRFDRCTGEFTSLGRFTYNDIVVFVGMAISANSRYAYHTASYHIFRFDLWADDIPASMDTVAVSNGYREPIDAPGFEGLTLRVIFHLAQLGPDGKIYIISSNSVRTMHVIERPDEHDCQVTQHRMMLPTLNLTIPHFPNYRLGALAGSPCDTLGATAVREPAPAQPRIQAHLLPNPATDYFVLALDLPADAPAASLHLSLSNQMGQVLRQYRLQAAQREQRFSTEGLPAGLYYVHLAWDGRPLPAQKLIVVR